MKKRILGVWDYTVVLTYLGFCSGIAGIIFALVKIPRVDELMSFILSLFCLLFCGLCDTFDGAIAKTKKGRTQSEKRFGAQIDSLSDLVCFGVLPAVIGFRIGWKQPGWIIVLAFYCLAALVRLAWFNVEEIEKEIKNALSAATAANPSCNGATVTDAEQGSASEEVALTALPEEKLAAKRKYYTGLPVTNASWIFPLVFCFKPLLQKNFGYLYAAALIVVGVLFVCKFKIKKLSPKQAIPFIIFCTALFIGLIVLSIVLELEW